MKRKDVLRIRRIVHENDKSKRLSHMQNEMGRLMRLDEQEQLSVWEGWHWGDNNGGWLDRELCAKARQEVEYIRRHKMYTRVWKCAYARPEGHPSRQDVRRLTRDRQGSVMCARDRLRRNTRHTPDQSCMRRHRHWRR